MADMHTRPNRRKEVWIKLHPAELADSVVSMATEFTLDELDKMLFVLNVQHQEKTGETK